MAASADINCLSNRYYMTLSLIVASSYFVCIDERLLSFRQAASSSKVGMSRRFEADHLGGSQLLYHHHNSVRRLEATPLQQQPSTEQTDSEQTITSHLSIPHFALHRQVTNNYVLNYTRTVI